jgi:hypothetical protein
VAILTILGSVVSVIWAVLKALPPTVWLCLVCFLLGVVVASKGCDRPRLFPLRDRQQQEHGDDDQRRGRIFPILRDEGQPCPTQK